MKIGRPTIALLTDFGDADGYVGCMKAVIRSIAPRVSFIDIAHNVRAHSPDNAAFVLWNTYAWYPKNTVFLCVVDPGVGTERPIIACTTKKGYSFVAPDNGLLKYIIHEEEITHSVMIDPAKLNIQHTSITFHGRDIMAPAAARCACGEDILLFGTTCDITNRAEACVTDADDAHVVHIDHFGNIITSLIHELSFISLECNGRVIDTIAGTYNEIPANECACIKGSSGLWEIAMKDNSAEKMIQCKTGDEIKVNR